jgi:hypothetical protein
MVTLVFLERLSKLDRHFSLIGALVRCGDRLNFGS